MYQRRAAQDTGQRIEVAKETELETNNEGDRKVSMSSARYTE